MTDEPQAVRKTRNFADVIRAKLAADPELAAEVEALMEDQAPFIEEIKRLHQQVADYRADLVRELGYPHWTEPQRYVLRLALKWLDVHLPEAS